MNPGLGVEQLNVLQIYARNLHCGVNWKLNLPGRDFNKDSCFFLWFLQETISIPLFTGWKK